MNKIKYLLVADGLSIFGGWIDFIVLLSIASFKFNINPFEISVLSALMLLPSIVLVNFIGKISNSHNSINYLLFFLLVRSIIGIILVLSNSLIIFSFFVILRSISNSFTLPLIQTVTAKNILHEHRGSYYSSLNIIGSMSKILAPALGGVISLFYNSSYSLIIASLFTFLSFVMFFKIRKSLKFDKIEYLKENNLKIKKPHITSDEKLFWNKILPSTFVFFLFVFMINNQLPIILKEIKMDESALGFLISSSALGNLLYSIYRIKLKKDSPLNNKNEFILPIVVIMIIFIVIGLLIHLDVISIFYLMILFFFSGLFSSKFSILLNIYLSTYMLKNLGYISSKLQAIQNSIIIVAPFIGAFILLKYNPAITFILCGFCGILSLFLFNFIVNNIPSKSISKISN